MLHNYRNRKERYVIKSFLSLSLILVSSIYSQETHVFWYKALQNNYTLIDSPGPNLPANSIVHEGKIVTCAHAPGLGWSYSGFSCGSSIDDDQGYCSFLYSVNLNDAALIGRVDSAFIRGEYKVANSASSGPLNHGGPINIRCGVADVTYGVDSIWQGGGGRCNLH